MNLLEKYFKFQLYKVFFEFRVPDALDNALIKKSFVFQTTVKLTRE